MGGIFYIIGVALAGFAGYSDLQWYFIFISSLVMAIGHLVIRSSIYYSTFTNDGVGAILKLLVLQIIGYSIITAPVYFVVSFFT